MGLPQPFNWTSVFSGGDDARDAISTSRGVRSFTAVPAISVNSSSVLRVRSGSTLNLVSPREPIPKDVTREIGF
jgi:hypothetical protein